MNAQKALGWILTHLGRSRRKHPNVDSTSNALSRIGLVFERAKQAAGQGGGPENLPLLARSLLETAGMCVRSVVDMRMEHIAMTPMPEGDMATDPWIVQLTVPTDLRDGVDFMDPQGLTARTYDWQDVQEPTVAPPTPAATTSEMIQGPRPPAPPIPDKPVPVDIPDWPDDPGRHDASLN
jgi:hypothetical protein